MGEEMILVSKSEYDSLVRDSDLLAFLEARGVDNWEGYCGPPVREDYETDKEYREAYEEALYG